MDSGAFTELSLHGRYRNEPEEYAAEIDRWYCNGQLLAAATQDYMCEPFITAKTGLSILDHQMLTIERFDRLMACRPHAYIMPVLQGYYPGDYAKHVKMYGNRLRNHDWVGVGSVCKRNANPASVVGVLEEVRDVRPDLMLHGFGLKITSLLINRVRQLLFSADSMAWSFAARREGRNANDWKEAKKFSNRISCYRGNYKQQFFDGW